MPSVEDGGRGGGGGDVETGRGRKPAAAAVYTTANSHNCSGVMPDRV